MSLRRLGIVLRGLLLAGGSALLAACGTLPVAPSPGHITHTPPADEIPPPVQQSALLPPPPRPAARVATYSVVVHQVAVRELLFALARDAGVNADIHPGIEGTVSMNAMEQTLPQLLDRIARQVALHYEWNGSDLVLTPDYPQMRHYRVDYVNMSRFATGTVRIRSTVGSTGGVIGATGGGTDTNESTFAVDLASRNDFWTSLEASLEALLSAGRTPGSDVAGQAAAQRDIIVHRESGLVGVRATARQHARVREFLDEVLGSAQRQVLIEATIVEIELNDDYQAGVDWTQLGSEAQGQTSIEQDLLGGNLMLPPAFKLKSVLWESGTRSLTATVRALSKFGDTRVLSSPRLMALNNQSAVLKVVDEVVYFEISREVTEATPTTARRTEFTSQIRTAPVGLVMMVTPQISAEDVVSLNVRPTVSRIIDYKPDPAARVFGDGVENLIPEVQVREMESMLRVPSGQTVVLGGLMQDDVRTRTSGVPVASRVPVVGNLFSLRNDATRKSELVVFLRPVVIKSAGLDGDLIEYRRYLPDPHERLNRRHGLFPPPMHAPVQQDLRP